MTVLIPKKDVGIVIIVSHVVSVDAGGKEMSCNCDCHDPNISAGRLCSFCAKNFINCKKHGLNKARENICWCLHSKITDCYRCHLEEYHRVEIIK